jgi:hypothetical protein
MAHVSNTFKESVFNGGFYYSKTGHDSNNGTTRDTPRKTWDNTRFDSADNYLRTNVIAAGHYRVSSRIGGESSIGTGSGACQVLFLGDGKVIIDQLGGLISQYASFKNIELRNGATQLGAFQHGGLSRGQIFEECILKSYELGNRTTAPPVISNGYFHFFKRTISLNSAWLTTDVSGSVYRFGVLNSILKGDAVAGGIYRVSRLINSYVHNDVKIQINITSGAPVPQTQWSDPSLLNQLGYSNIRGLILMQGTNYAVQDALTGTPQDNGYAVGVRWLNESELTSAGFTGIISGWNALVATLMNRDPEFINITDNYFGLASTSPHIGAGYDGTNIGGTRISDFVGVGQDGIADKTVILSAEIDDTDPDDVHLDLTEPEGNVRFINYLNGPMGKIDLDIDYLFDSDEAGGDANNNNVPDAEPSLTDYPDEDLTVANGSTTTFIIDNAGTPSIGGYTRVLGEVRAITNVQADTPIAGQKTVTVASAFRAAINSGTVVSYGTRDQIALMSPNRLCVLMRFSTNDSGTPPNPATDADWDNFGLGAAGVYYLQELEKVPGIYDIAGNYFGAGDSLRPTGGVFYPVNNCWFDAKVVLINRFSHQGK